MALSADFILEYLPTWQTIQKSTSLMQVPLYIYADKYIRILLSCIRNMGSCPCPRCLIPKTAVHLVGTKGDKSKLKKLARVDNLQYRVKISNARDIIYQQLRGVNSTFVEDILKPESLVPTEVFFKFLNNNAALCILT